MTPHPQLKVVEFPEMHAATSIPDALRKLADQIEAKEFGDAHQLAWVIDCGDSHVEVGLLGKAASPGAEALLLLSVGVHKIVSGVAA